MKRKRGKNGRSKTKTLTTKSVPPPVEVRFKMTGWPDDVPILTQHDIVYQFESRNNRRDLFWWLVRTFDLDHHVGKTPYFDTAYKTLCEVITERLGKRVTCLWLFLEFTWQRKFPSKPWLAACWNEMLYRLGYTVTKADRRDPGFK